ncbi:MAG: hypothetical protein N3D10_00425 [Candidatus Micrarchaeota archaeon]|nr:hypothetical protein [Candidatus Micrarchaeota archaeon]
MPGSIFKNIKNNFLRTLLEVLVSAIPGTIILSFFIFLIGLLNIFFNLSEANDITIFFYFPVVCILPLIIGILAPLILEKVQGTETINLKLSFLVSFISSFVGSTVSSFILMVIGFGFGSFKPFGFAPENFLPSPFGLIVGSFILVFSSVFLSLLGTAIYITLLKKLEG